MWELDHREVWAPNNSCFWTVVLEKTLESPLDSKGIQPVNPKGNQSWIFIGKMLKLKLQYFGHLLSRTDSLEKTLMLGKIEGRRRRGTSEDEIVGWHHWLDGHDFEQALGVSDGQRGLACCSPLGCKKLDMTERLNWLCPTLCDPMSCSLPGFSVHGILQARILEQVTTSSSRESSWPSDQTCVSCKSLALQADSLLLNHWGSQHIIYMHVSGFVNPCNI